MHPLVEFIKDAAHLAHVLKHFWLIDGIARLKLMAPFFPVAAWFDGGIILEICMLDQAKNGIDAEAIDAALEPEAESVVHGCYDVGIAPVEVWLFGQEAVHVILLRLFVPGPGGAAKHGGPVVGHGAIWFGVAPDVPIAFGIVARAAGFQEPGVLVGGVVGYKVENNFEAALLGFVQQAVEGGQIAKHGVDIAVVGDIVAEVGHGAGEDGRNPDGVDAEIDQIVEPVDDALQVADAVAGAVLKAAGVDLVEDGRLPPFGVVCAVGMIRFHFVSKTPLLFENVVLQGTLQNLWGCMVRLALQGDRF